MTNEQTEIVDLLSMHLASLPPAEREAFMTEAATLYADRVRAARPDMSEGEVSLNMMNSVAAVFRRMGHIEGSGGRNDRNGVSHRSYVFLGFKLIF
jgi:hypothetical protein